MPITASTIITKRSISSHFLAIKQLMLKNEFCQLNYKLNLEILWTVSP